MSTGTDITAFLKGKGSPLADHVPDILASANRYRVDPRLLVAIAGGETSFGKAGRGPAVFNAWGIGPGRAYGSWADGIDQAAKLLRENYIGKGLTSMAAIQKKWAPVLAANDPKNLNSNWLRVNGGFYSELGGNPNNVTLGWRTGSAPGVGIPLPKVTKPPVGSVPRVAFDSVMADTAFQNLGRIAAGGKPDTSLSGLVGAVKAQADYDAAQPAPVATPPPTSAGKQPTKAERYKAPSVKKGLLVAPTVWQGTHITDNLDWNHGKKTAVDLFAKAGTAVGAPEDGKIIRWGSAQGGESLYFLSDSGHEYWMGHIDDRLPVGTVVKKGTPIAVISSKHKVPHLHLDRRN